MSTSCPGCHKPVVVEDIVVTGLKRTQKLQTCGRIVIKSRGRVIAGAVEAQSGLEVHGALTTGERHQRRTRPNRRQSPLERRLQSPLPRDQTRRTDRKKLLPNPRQPPC